LTSLFQSNRHVYVVQTMLRSVSGLLDMDTLSKYKRGGTVLDWLVLVPKWRLA